MRFRLSLSVVFFLSLVPTQAGMTMYDLNDVVRLRLEDISFFTVLLLLCVFGVKLLWNALASDFPRLPRLTFSKAFCLTTLLSLAMLLVLSMISGARELLTPGAWRKQGTAYRLNAREYAPLRRRGLESLRAALYGYAQTNKGSFPSHDFVPGIAEKLWQSPDGKGTRYVYMTGLTSSSGKRILACEPLNFGDLRFVLYADGEIDKLSTKEIREHIGSSSGHR